MAHAKRLFFIGIDGMNWPMSSHFIAEGEMPRLKALRERGASTEIFPCFPAYTPTNWATLCTGAYPGTHGEPGWTVTMPDGREVSSFTSCALNAETIWEAAERAGHRICLFNYPASMPLPLKNGCAVDNSFGNPLHPQYSTPERLAEPPEMGRELVERFGPYPLSFEASDLDAWTRRAQWIAEAGRFLMEQHGYTFFYCHFHIIDHLLHLHLAGADPASPAYVEAEAAAHMEVLRSGHRIVDGLIETLTRDAKDTDLIVVVSDHGNSPNQRMVDVNRWLVEKGYLVLKDRAQAAVEKDPALDRNPAISFDAIDWDKTTAFRKPGLGLDLTVNASGEEYERIRNRLVRDLRTWVDDETGRTVMAVVLKREDAYPLGFWGPDVGDVAVVYEKGYAWTTLPDGTALAPGSGANHGPQFPTAHTDFASVLAFITAAGPGVKPGYLRDPAHLGHAHMTDVVPTLCRLLGFDPPAHAQGAILRDFLNGVDASPRRPATTPRL